MKYTVFNFGHALADTTKEKIENTLQPFTVEHVKINVSIDMQSDVLLEDQMLEIIKPFISQMTGEKPFAIIAPGMSNAAMVLISQINGILGRMPDLIELRFSENKIFDFHRLICLHDVRNNMRKFR